MSEKISFRSPRLPAEIVGQIIFLLPSADRRTALSVSRQFHAFALSLVFSTFHLSFGHWSTFGYNQRDDDSDEDDDSDDDSDEDDDSDDDSDEGSDDDSDGDDDSVEDDDSDETRPKEDDYEMENRYNERSRDILEYISNTPDFGKLVKKIIVRSFTLNSLVSECRSLNRAFGNMPNLASFHWTGISPNIPAKVVTGLANFCPNLEELRVLGVSIPRFEAPKIARLKNLRSFHYLPDWNAWVRTKSDATFDLRLIPFLDEMPKAVSRVVNASNMTLKNISMYGPYSSVLSPKILDHLSELCLWKITDPLNVGTVLHHAKRLRSLTLNALDDSDIAALFEDDSLALPQLTAFRLLVEEGDGDEYTGLDNFLRRHPTLRRLALDVSLEDETFFSCLSVFPEMTELDTLSLSIGDWSEDFIQSMFSFVPDRLRALCLGTSKRPPTAKQSVKFAAKLNALPSLLFIHFATWGRHSEWSPRNGRFIFTTLTRGCGRLRFLGINKTMASLTRVGSNPAEVEVRRWPDGLLSTSAEDFDGLEEAEWLMQFIDFSPWVI